MVSNDLRLRIFLSELSGTFILMLGGTGVSCNCSLTKTKGYGSGWIVVVVGWGTAVLMGCLVSRQGGGHLNPAVTLGMTVKAAVAGDDIDGIEVLLRFCGEFLGAFLGSTFAWLAYKLHFDETEDSAVKLGVFSTCPQIRNCFFNLMTEIIATFVLVYTIIGTGAISSISGINDLIIFFIIIGIGCILGGPTGYAINPARDLSPRIAHAILPISGKCSSDWGYSWIPVLGPFIGGAIAGACSALITEINK